MASGGGESEGGWRESAAATKEISDDLLTVVGDFLGRHGWTMVLVVFVWYNCKDAVSGWYRHWLK